MSTRKKSLNTTSKVPSRGAGAPATAICLTGGPPSQAASAERLIAKGAWVSALALAEAAWVLTSVCDLTSQDLVKAIEMLLHHRDLALQDPDVIAGALELFRARPALSFSDCMMLQSARKAGHLPLGTFDRNLAKVEGAQKL